MSRIIFLLFVVFSFLFALPAMAQSTPPVCLQAGPTTPLWTEQLALRDERRALTAARPLVEARDRTSPVIEAIDNRLAEIELATTPDCRSYVRQLYTEGRLEEAIAALEGGNGYEVIDLLTLRYLLAGSNNDEAAMQQAIDDAERMRWFEIQGYNSLTNNPHLIFGAWARDFSDTAFLFIIGWEEQNTALSDGDRAFIAWHLAWRAVELGETKEAQLQYDQYRQLSGMEDKGIQVAIWQKVPGAWANLVAHYTLKLEELAAPVRQETETSDAYDARYAAWVSTLVLYYTELARAYEQGGQTTQAADARAWAGNWAKQLPAQLLVFQWRLAIEYGGSQLVQSAFRAQDWSTFGAVGVAEQFAAYAAFTGNLIGEALAVLQQFTAVKLLG